MTCGKRIDTYIAALDDERLYQELMQSIPDAHTTCARSKTTEIQQLEADPYSLLVELFYQKTSQTTQDVPRQVSNYAQDHVSDCQALDCQTPDHEASGHDSYQSFSRPEQDKELAVHPLALLGLSDEEVLNHLRTYMKRCTPDEIARACQAETPIFSGLICYYFHQYNLYMAAVLILFMLVYDPDAHEYMQQHITFLRDQKRQDGRVGYINPLKDYTELDTEFFYKLNGYSLCALERYVMRQRQV